MLQYMLQKNLFLNQQELAKKAQAECILASDSKKKQVAEVVFLGMFNPNMRSIIQETWHSQEVTLDLFGHSISRFVPTQPIFG